MKLDVKSDIAINRPRGMVVDYTSNLENLPVWYKPIKRVEWKTEPRLCTGARVALVEGVAGGGKATTYEVTDWVPGGRLVIQAMEGSSPLEMTFTWEPMPGDTTRMTIRARAETKGWMKLFAPLAAGGLRDANKKALKRLKKLLEV